jgi:hypothetical protein
LYTAGLGFPANLEALRSVEDENKASSQFCLRFKPRKNTGGDTAGKSSVEPYAYWQFDRKMLNR